MTDIRTLRIEAAAMEAIHKALDDARVHVSAKCLPSCPKHLLADVRDLLGTISDALDDFKGGALRDIRNAIEDHEADEAAHEMSDRRRDYFRAAL